MLTTTFNLVKEAGACRASYRKFAEYKGSIKSYGADTPFPLTEVLEVCGFDDALWCLGHTQQPDEAKRVACLFSVECAGHVLHFFETQFPDDKRPRNTLELCQHWLETGEECDLEAASYAAWVAAGAAWAASDAARAAADAARDATDAARAAAGAARAAAYAAWAATDAARAAAGAARDAAYAAWAAADAAWAASYAARAAAGAARDAAYAAWAAEREWQANKLKEYLSQ